MTASWDDAMITTFGDGDEWTETWWCGNCGEDRMMSLELHEGRVLGMCPWCEDRQDYTPPDEVIAWCSACHRTRMFIPLPDDVNENEPDPDFPLMLCLGCGCAQPPEDEPRRYVVAQETPYMRVTRTRGYR